MMNKAGGSLDTNVLLRLLLRDIPDQHKAALKLFKEATSPLAVADAALLESVYVLTKHYEYTRSQTVEILSGLLSLAKINCNRQLFMKAFPVYLKRPSLSFVDCCLAVYAELNQAEPLWTFDRKLARQMPNARLVSAA